MTPKQLLKFLIIVHEHKGHVFPPLPAINVWGAEGGLSPKILTDFLDTQEFVQFLLSFVT